MKTTVLSKEALGKLTLTPKVEVPAPKAEQATAPATGAGEEQAAGGDLPAVETPMETPEEQAADAGQIQEKLTATEEKLTAAEENVAGLTTEVAGLKESLAGKDGQIEKMTAEIGQLTEVVGGIMASMRMALNLSAVEMKDWDVPTLMREFESVSKTFQASMPEGSLTQDNPTVTQTAKAAAGDSITAADFRAVGLN